MKKNLWIVLGILGCLAIAAIAYFWTSGLMDSVYAYRSPLKENPPSPGQAIGEPMTRRVVFVLIDGLREDTSLKPEVMPFLNELRQQGAWARMHSRPPSYSAPSYAVLLTGAWPDISDGPAMNPEGNEIPTFTQDDIFSAAHRSGLKTAVSGYFWFEGLIPQEAVDAVFSTRGEDAAADREVVDTTLPWLQSKKYPLVLIHIDQVDYAGHHEGGARDPRWDAAARRADDLLREVVAVLDLEQDTILVLSDHGHIDRGGHGGQDAIVLLEPFVLAGKGVKPGHYPDVQMVDVAATIGALLGTNIPASSQGHVLTDMLAIDEERTTVIRDLVAYQQIQLEQTYVPAIGQKATKVLVEPGKDVVDTYQQAMDKARNARLIKERIPRFVIALIILFIPTYVLFRRRGHTVAWLLGGGLLYILLFKIRYSVLEGRTYSLSSVISQSDLITFNAVTAAIALTIAWLAVMLILGAFRQGPRRGAETVLGLVFTTLYLLSLPILGSYALNGALVTWTLPDYASMFMGFISLVQSLMVAVVGLVLTGVSAVIALVVGKVSK